MKEVESLLLSLPEQMWSSPTANLESFKKLQAFVSSDVENAERTTALFTWAANHSWQATLMMLNLMVLSQCTVLRQDEFLKSKIKNLSQMRVDQDSLPEEQKTNKLLEDEIYKAMES